MTNEDKQLWVGEVRSVIQRLHYLTGSIQGDRLAEAIDELFHASGVIDRIAYALHDIHTADQQAAIIDRGCTLPPPGWWCSREVGHGGPCAARSTTMSGETA